MERLDRIEKLIEELAISQQEASAEMRISQQETSAMFKETDVKFKKLHQDLAFIGHSNGDAAEAFFYNSLEDNKVLGNVKFDEIIKNIKQKKHRQQDEYDIFLENGNAVGVIEVKYKVQKNHIEKLIEKKAENFRILFPDYSDYKLYIGIAGLSFEPETEEYAVENGLVVLKQKGELMQVNTSNMRAF
jgi:hypothetical protein